MSKVTKKMRKLANRNEQVARSAKQGNRLTLGKHLYYGKAPKYAEQKNSLGMVVGYIMVEKGVPFVRDTYEV